MMRKGVVIWCLAVTLAGLLSAGCTSTYNYRELSERDGNQRPGTIAHQHTLATYPHSMATLSPPWSDSYQPWYTRRTDAVP